MEDGYRINDAVVLAPVVGELPYLVGAAARAAVANSWPMLNASLPVDATYVLLSCTEDVLIRFISSDLIAGYLTGAYGVYTSAVQHFFLADTAYVVPVKCTMISYVRDTVDGQLRISFYA